MTYGTEPRPGSGRRTATAALVALVEPQREDG